MCLEAHVTQAACFCKGSWQLPDISVCYLTHDPAANEHITVVVYRGHPQPQAVCSIGRSLLCILATLKANLLHLREHLAAAMT